MNSASSWFPIPRSWLNGLGLILLVAGLQFGMGLLLPILMPIIRLFPTLYALISVFITVTLIAFAHHWLHRFLDQLFPETRFPETEATPGKLPDLMSWWEGLYGWMVSYLCLLVWSSLISFISRSLFITDQLTQISVSVLASPWRSLGGWLILLYFTTQISVAALFYQFEYRVRDRLMSAASNR